MNFKLKSGKRIFTLTCEECLREFECGNVTGKWCSECRPQKIKESKRAGSRRRWNQMSEAAKESKRKRERERKRGKTAERRTKRKEQKERRQAQLAGMLKCQRCGEKMPKRSTFCGFCQEEMELENNGEKAAA